tara:strand:- start:262 stop:531 length:270 start_codon:yes stop_codon:yes gene_type:complete
MNEIAEERIVIRNKINNFTDEEMQLAIFVCEEMKKGYKESICMKEHMENWIYKTGYDLNYHEKVKDILWEYISKNDEEEIFKRIAEVKQ